MYSSDVPPGGLVGGEATHVVVGFAGDGVVVVERHHIGIRERLVDNTGWGIRGIGGAGRGHGDDAGAGPTLVVIAPEGDPVMLLADTPGTVVVQVIVFIH